MRPAFLAAFASLAMAVPASAASVVNGITFISQADATAGGVTPGDTAGYPITISAPGSYRLMGNLSVPPGQSGLYVTANEVTVDLAGFSILGNGTGGFGINAIRRSFTVTNGTIRGFAYDGIFVSAPVFRIENMRLAENGRYGINGVYVNSSPKTGREDGQSIIKNNIVFGNLQGITCQSSCHIDGNVITFNTYSAIIISQSGATVINNTIANNGGYGVVGNYIGLSNNTIFQNAYCHTSGVMIVGTRNMIYPTTNGPYCTALPGN